MNYGGIVFILAMLAYWTGAAVHTHRKERKLP